MLKPWNNFSAWCSLPALWVATMGAYGAGGCTRAQALPACVQGQSVDQMSGLCGRMQIHFPPPPVFLIEAVLVKKNGFISSKSVLAVRALLRNTEAVGLSIWESLKYRQGPNCCVFSSTRPASLGTSAVLWKPPLNMKTPQTNKEPKRSVASVTSPLTGSLSATKASCGHTLEAKIKVH